MKTTAYRPMEPAALFRLGDPVQADVRGCQARIGSAVLLFVCAGLLHAQALRPPTPPEIQDDNGWWLRSATVYGTYYSTVLPSGSISPVPASLGSEVPLGGSADVEWMTHRQHSTFSLMYVPSYTSRIRYSWNALNQHLALNATWGFAPRWKLASSIIADVSNLEGFLFAPTVFSNVASISPDPASLSASILDRPYTNTELGMLLNSGVGAESPIRTLLYGQRVLSATARLSISHSYSPRLSINFDGSANRYQHVGGQPPDIPQTAYLIAATTSATASLGVSYSVSPRTQLGASVVGTRVVSGFNDSYSTTSTSTLGRTLGRRWFVRLHAGTGFVIPLQKTMIASTRAHPVGGAILGFMTFAHTFLGSFEQTAGDPYAVGASTTSTSTASWRWQRPDSPWQLYSSFSWQQLQGVDGQAGSSWRVTGGWGRRLQRDIVLQTEYAHQNYSGLLGSVSYIGSQSALRISMEWISLRQPHR